MAIDESIDMHLYWVAENREDLYLGNLCRSWNDALESFNYHPVIDKEIKQSILDDQINLTDCDVYLAGSESQTKDTKEWLLNTGLPQNQLFTDNLS